MIKFEHTEVVGWEAAVRGMRNPLESWDKSDSEWGIKIFDEDSTFDYEYIVGTNDKDLMKRLRNAGSDHRKFMRMIVVYVDITAPLYWWKEFDTYKVGTVANSCSTMHTIHKRDLELDDFSREHLDSHMLALLEKDIHNINWYRRRYAEAKNKRDWWQIIQMVPTSFNQKRTVMLNYEVLLNMYKSRKNHKLDEWRDLCSWIETLPYSELITGEE